MNIRKYIELFSREMEIMNFSSRTISSYVSCADIFLKHFSEYDEPKSINEDDIKNYLIKIGKKSTAWVKQNIGALKLFYTTVVRQPLKFKYIPYPKREQKLPTILSVEEIQDLLNAIKNLKHKAIVALLYSCGLRVSEAINLKITDIDSKRMLVKIVQSKGAKDRYVPLCESVLKLLRYYYKEYKPKTFLFNGQASEQYSMTSIQQFLKHYAKSAKIKKHVHPHQLRHSFAVHHLEKGTDSRYIQLFMGHSNPKTTQRYTHVANLNLNLIKSPIETIYLKI